VFIRRADEREDVDEREEADVSIVVLLQDVVDAMDEQSDELHAYLNKVTGELITVTTEALSAVEEGEDWDEEPQWQQDVLADAKQVFASDDFLPLPSEFDIHEYTIMEDFCDSIEKPRLRDEMLSRIRGSGAFRRFKDGIHFHGIQEDWYRFRQQALEAIAIEWLEDNGIAFTRSSDNSSEA
jgi:hypothetical protein